MARQDINRGSAANDGTGDTLYAAGGKINANFTELYSQFDAREVVPVLSTSGGSAAANGAALAAAVATARSANGYVRLPAGRYPMTCALTTGAIIEFSPETVLLQEQNAAVLSIDLSGSAVGPHTITAFTLTKHTNNAGASTNKFLRLTMSPTDAANYAVGDAIMVSSQDARTYYTGNTNYAGEMAFVTAVEAGSGYVYVDGGLWLHGVGTLFTTTPVARRLARDTVRLIRPQVEANGNVYSTIVGGSWPGAIELKAVPRPQIEGLRINSAWGIGLYFKSCAAFRVTNFRIADCPGDPANNRYGYGILARGACNAGQIVDGYIERTRHGITTDCREAASWVIGNVWDHGDCTDLVVDGVIAASNGAPPFDTHENSVNTTFRNCHAVGARYSTQGITGATGYGFNLRGPYDKVINCEASDCEGGVDVAATGLIHEIVGENVIDGFTFRGEATNNLAGHGIVIDGNAAETTPQRVSVRNLRASVGSRGVLVSAGYTGRLMFEGCTFRGFLDTQVRVQASCTIDMVNCHIDMTEAGTSELCISVDNSNTVALNLFNLTLRTKNATTPVAVVNTAVGATANIRHTNVCDINGNSVVLAAGAGANNVTLVTPVVPNGTLLPAYLKSYGEANPVKYGAGDRTYSPNDDAAFAAALAEGKRDLYIPYKSGADQLSYLLTSTLVLPQNTTMYGDGTNNGAAYYHEYGPEIRCDVADVIKMTSGCRVHNLTLRGKGYYVTDYSSTDVTTIASPATNAGIVIDDAVRAANHIEITHVATKYLHRGIDLSGASAPDGAFPFRVRVEDIKSDFNRYGLYSLGTSLRVLQTADLIRIWSNFNGDGIFFDNIQNVHFRQIEIVGNRVRPLVLNRATNFSITEGNFENDFVPDNIGGIGHPGATNPGVAAYRPLKPFIELFTCVNGHLDRLRFLKYRLGILSTFSRDITYGRIDQFERQDTVLSGGNYNATIMIYSSGADSSYLNHLILSNIKPVIPTNGAQPALNGQYMCVDGREIEVVNGRDAVKIRDGVMTFEQSTNDVNGGRSVKLSLSKGQIDANGLPTSTGGLSAGSLWVDTANGNVLKRV